MAFQNANGNSHGGTPATDIIETSLDLEIDIFGIAELNCRLSDSIVSNINALLKRSFGCSIIPHSPDPTPSLSSNSGYLPGGVMQLVQGKNTSAHKTHGSNKYGQYTWATFHGPHDSKLCIITAYRVSQGCGTQPTTPDCSTAYWQPFQSMISNDIHNPNPKIIILCNLTRFIANKTMTGYEIILMMDANEDIDNHQLASEPSSQQTQLHNIHRTQLLIVPPTTRLNSCHRIDFIFASNTLCFVQRSGFFPAHEGLVSDHIMLWINFDMASFLGGYYPPTLTPPPPNSVNFHATTKIPRHLHQRATQDLQTPEH